MNNVVEQLEKEFVDKDISLCVLLKGRMRKAPKNIRFMIEFLSNCPQTPAILLMLLMIRTQ
jgi:hypothetical protein